MLLYSTVGPDDILPSASELPAFAVFAQNYSLDTLMQLNPVLWTLSVEAAFYVALPLIAAVGARTDGVGGHALLLVGLVAAGIGFNMLDHQLVLGEVARKTLAAWIGIFAIGMLAALWSNGARLRPTRELGTAMTFALMAAGVLVVIAVGTFQELAPPGTVERALFATLTAATGFALIVAAAAGGRGPATAWLRWRGLIWVG